MIVLVHENSNEEQRDHERAVIHVMNVNAVVLLVLHETDSHLHLKRSRDQQHDSGHSSS